jgi:uncharacterized membrane protein YbaN (DUF454 family)
MSAAAAVRLFAGEADKRWTGVVLPGVAATALTLVLVAGFLHEEPAPRVFIAASAIIGLPLAVWRGRTVRRASKAGAGASLGSRF